SQQGNRIAVRRGVGPKAEIVALMQRAAAKPVAGYGNVSNLLPLIAALGRVSIRTPSSPLSGKKPAVRRGYAASGSGRRSTLKPSLAIWAAKRLALISVERRSKWLAPRS